MKKYLVTFPITTGTKKRLITTYRSDQYGSELRDKHQADLALLEAQYKLNTDYAFAYIKSQSIKNLVAKHLDNRYFYQFDIKNFFGSIDHSLLLAMLNATDDDFNHQLIHECSNNKPVGLALGLIPSPYLSNIYLSQFDYHVVTALNKLGANIVYTRYSDDLTISSPSELSLDELTTILQTQLAALNLQLHPNKTRSIELFKKGQHIKVLGLNVIRGENSNYVTVGRKFKANTIIEKDRLRKSAMQAYIDYNER